MALREYKCGCGNVFDELIFGEHPKTRKCTVCGGSANYRIAAPIFRVSFHHGWDPGAGEHFDSQRQRDTFLDRNDLVKTPDYGHGFGDKVREDG